MRIHIEGLGAHIVSKALPGLLAALVTLAPSALLAKTLYVDAASGNDATTYAANSAASPWRSIGRAAWGSTNRSAPNTGEAARAGDVVMIAAGTYTTTGQNNRWLVAYNPVNEGTAASPIRFQASGVTNLTFSSGAGPMIGSNNRNHIQWSGFTISESTAPTVSDTGPVVFFGSDFDYVQGGSLENSVLTGNANWMSREGDNYNGIRLEYTNGQRIVNNTIRNYGGDTDSGGGGIDHNHSGITTYKWENLTVENNVFDNCGAGMYLKATQTTTREVGVNTIRFNIFRNNSKGIQVHRSPNTASEPILIYQNVFHNNTSGVRILMFNDATDPMHVKVFSNTFDAHSEAALVIGTSGNIPAGAGYVFWNNIVSGGPFGVIIQHPAANLTPEKFDAEHNMYSGVQAVAEVSAQNVAFSAWQNTYRMDVGDGAGGVAGITNGNAMFVNQGGRDYRLQAGSPARTIGRVHPTYSGGYSPNATIPAGAYITGNEAIGTGAQAPPPPTSNLPTAPTNLRIVPGV